MQLHSLKVHSVVKQCGAEQLIAVFHYLNKEGVPFIVAFNGLDCNILSFPQGFEDNSKGSSANSLNR